MRRPYTKSNHSQTQTLVKHITQNQLLNGNSAFSFPFPFACCTKMLTCNHFIIIMLSMRQLAIKSLKFHSMSSEHTRISCHTLLAPLFLQCNQFWIFMPFQIHFAFTLYNFSIWNLYGIQKNSTVASAAFLSIFLCHFVAAGKYRNRPKIHFFSF